MGSQQSTNIRYMAIKPEVTPGTWVEPVNADFDIRFENIELSTTVEMDDEGAKTQNGNHGEAVSIAGVQSGTVSANVRLAFNSGGSIHTPPSWFTAANACGQENKVWTTRGVGLYPRKAQDDTTYSIAIYDTEIGEASPVTTITKLVGCVGNMVVSVDSMGKPYMGNFSYSGGLYDRIDGTALDMTAPDTVIPRAFLSESVTWNSQTFKIAAFSLDYGNEIQPVYDQSKSYGISHYIISKRSPRISMNPLASKQATWDVNANLIAESTSPVLIGTAGEMTIKGVNAQMISAAESSREGLNAWDINLKCLANGTTAALIDSGLTAEDTIELLQGARV